MSRQSLTVLVADPDPTLSNTLSEMLKVRGHAVSAATATAPALTLLETIFFDVAVIPVDKHSSQLDMAFIHAARERQPSLKIVGISANIDEPSAATAASVNAFIRKPFSIAQLETALHAAVTDVA